MIVKKHFLVKLYVLIVNLFINSFIPLAYSNNPSSHEQENEILTLNIEDLLNLEVTSVGKKEQKLSDTAAAIFVITAKDIRQSGVTTIPEALRMAPGIEVARLNANKWAITSRGFNSRFANKLLVMIDGRTIYTPLFSGVYWEVQDTVLEDIERIEVIRGSGGTLWGANAVNGVINIITKNSVDTQGTLAVIGGGQHEQAFSTLRYGNQINEQSYAKAYLKGKKINNFELTTGEQANDDWNMLQTGGRIDSQINHDQFTLQSDFYRNKISEDIIYPSITPPYQQLSNQITHASGFNLLGRWQHSESLSSDYTLQAYYDYNTWQDDFINTTHYIFDLDFQHHFSYQDNHVIVWGMGYR
jgi:iron complex outermembrane receptor protein